MLYRSVNHRIKDVAAKLCGDIETNPGPVVVDCEKLFVLHIVKEML